jgi:CBS domain containing-hemolysin-like protein
VYACVFVCVVFLVCLCVSGVCVCFFVCIVVSRACVSETAHKLYLVVCRVVVVQSTMMRLSLLVLALVGVLSSAFGDDLTVSTSHGTVLGHYNEQGMREWKGTDKFPADDLFHMFFCL